MIDHIQDILEKITVFDYSYIILTILLMIRGAFKGFVLSILSAAKWVLAYVLTIFIFPKVKPYVENILDNEYVLDVILGVSLFVLIIFLILMINKAISKAVTYSGIGTIDKFASITWRHEAISMFDNPDFTKPDLIIQDELHLISGPLGSIAGMYEILLSALTEKKINNK